jgi:hypothetical protein
MEIEPEALRKSFEEEYRRRDSQPIQRTVVIQAARATIVHGVILPTLMDSIRDEQFLSTASGSDKAAIFCKQRFTV